MYSAVRLLTNRLQHVYNPQQDTMFDGGMTALLISLLEYIDLLHQVDRLHQLQCESSSGDCRNKYVH